MKLTVQKRETLGKKVKNLRNEGIIPVSMFGPNKGPVNVQVDAKEFRKVFKEAGFNKFIDVTIEGEKDSYKVLVKDVAIHPVKDYIENVGLYRIDESRKISVDMPITFQGVSKVVTDKVGFLVHNFESITIYALPKDIPSEIIVDVTGIEKPGDSVSISEIDLPEGVELDSSIEATNSVVYAVSIQKKTIEEEEAEEAAEGEEGEGAESAEGEGDAAAE